MWSKIRKMIISPPVISAIPIAFVVTFGGYLSYPYNMILKDNRDLVVHTYQVISAVERAFSDIQDAENGAAVSSSRATKSSVKIVDPTFAIRTSKRRSAGDAFPSAIALALSGRPRRSSNPLLFRMSSAIAAYGTVIPTDRREM
jgi:hypothetical protein